MEECLSLFIHSFIHSVSQSVSQSVIYSLKHDWMGGSVVCEIEGIR